MARTSTIYLLHFTPPYAAPIAGTDRIKTAGHYLGSTAGTVEQRLAEHLEGRGSPLVKAALAAGCAVELVATWPGGRQLERRVKRNRHLHRHCPKCTPAPKPLPRLEHGR